LLVIVGDSFVFEIIVFRLFIYINNGHKILIKQNKINQNKINQNKTIILHVKNIIFLTNIIMSLAKSLLKITHDTLAQHIAEGVAKYIKTHIEEILPKTLNQLDELYDVNKDNEDVTVISNSKGSHCYQHNVRNNAEKIVDIKGNYKQHTMCKSMDNQIVVDGVAYKMVPVQVKDNSGKLITMLAYVQTMKTKDDEENLKLSVDEK